MKIRSLSIRNYRQYRELDFDLRDERNDVTIVVGANGAGKTNLLNAIIWCLYEREDYYGRDNESSPLVNQKAIDEAKDGALLSVSVTLEVEFADTTEATIKRKQMFVKQGRGAKPREQEFTIAVLENVAKGHQKVGDPDHWIGKNIPARLEPYFLFDGERLNDFFLHAEEKKVEEAVLQIAQIDLLARLTEHLEKVSDSLYSAAARASGGVDLEVMARRYEQRREELEKIDGDIKRRRAEVEQGEDTVRLLESKMGNVQEIVADFQRRKKLEADHETYSSELLDSWSDLKSWAVGTAPAVLASSALGGLCGAVDAARADRRLPPPVDADFLRQLLDEGVCVCGCSLESGTDGGNEHRLALEKLLAEYAEVSQLGDALLGLERGARDALARIRLAAPAADSILKRIEDWQKRQQAAAEAIKVLDDKLAGNDNVQVQQTEAQLNAAKKALDQARRELSRREWEADELRRDIASLKDDLERQASKVEKARTKLQQARFSKECLKVAERIHQDLTDEVRERVAGTLERHFKSMIWKRENIASVSIDDKYRVSVINNMGFELLPDLSAGERECLALAFSLALSEVSGYELPMVIDTPMGRLDPDVQKFMAGVLAQSTQGVDGDGNHQLIMLMTKTEYNDNTMKVFAARQPRVLEIDFDETSSISRLKEVS